MSYLETPTRHITVNNQKIAYRELGEGNSDIPLVMLVHLAATMDDWDPKLLDLLAEHQHLIVMDLPGVGSSEGSVATTIPGMAHQATEIIQALGYQKVNLLGLSMGGMIAQEVVRAYPPSSTAWCWLVPARAVALESMPSPEPPSATWRVQPARRLAPSATSSTPTTRRAALRRSACWTAWMPAPRRTAVPL